MSTIWKKYDEILNESINYIEKRANGTIKSLKTGWEAFNKIGMNGIEWNSIYIISSRPGVGKTLIDSQIKRDVLYSNPDQNFGILSFQFEMLGRNMILRDMSAGTNLNLRYISSAKDDGMPSLSRTDFERLKQYTETLKNREYYIVDKPLTVNQISATVDAFYAYFRRPFLITLDHTMLIKKDASETNKQSTLENFSTMMVEKKNKYPITWIILSQLNREIDGAERQVPGKLGNYPCEADVYGSDFMMQCCDVMIAFNRPAKYNLRFYGPRQYVIQDTDANLLAAHVLKNRYGELSIQWYRANYATMSLLQATPPQTKNF